MPEWLKGADCKSAGFAYVGSNPTRPNSFMNLQVIYKKKLIYDILINEKFLKI